jgi:hypothetical protein
MTKNTEPAAKPPEPLRRIMLMARDIAPDQKPFWRPQPTGEPKTEIPTG